MRIDPQRMDQLGSLAAAFQIESLVSTTSAERDSADAIRIRIEKLGQSPRNLTSTELESLVSMKAAIENLANMKARKKVAILGDMFELEDEVVVMMAQIDRMSPFYHFRQRYMNIALRRLSL